jgi:hypothetical protein
MVNRCAHRYRLVSLQPLRRLGLRGVWTAVLRYTEYGGYYTDERIRALRPELVQFDDR